MYFTIACATVLLRINFMGPILLHQKQTNKQNQNPKKPPQSNPHPPVVISLDFLAVDDTPQYNYSELPNSKGQD